MKRTLIILLAIITLISCDENDDVIYIKASFDNSFSKRSKNLTNKLGNEFAIKHNKDTLTFLVSYDKKEKVNSIINKKTNDTIFSGLVNKYRGLYYFNKQVNDSSYWIYAVEINNGTIKGLETDWVQMSYLSEQVEKSLHDNSELKGIVKSVYNDTSEIRLTPNKKLLKEFYYSIIDSLQADTFISGFDCETQTELSNNGDVDLIKGLEGTSNNEMILNLYPNPANEFITIETDKPYENIYMIANINGQVVMIGKIKEKLFKIDISELKSGTYFIKLDKENGQTETSKFIIE